MRKVRLGRTGLTVSKNGFGALPIQRTSSPEAEKILWTAYENGIDFFDTARYYTDSEIKIGNALSAVRDKIVIASKTMALEKGQFWKDLETTLTNLRTDHLDLYQFHNPPFMPVPGGEDGLYDAVLEAQRQGKIRYIGFTNHRLHLANSAVDSGLFDTIQFPFSYLATEQEEALVARCKACDVGFIAMKGLSGGLITDAALAYAWMLRFENVLPIWGIQRETELRQFLQCGESEPELTAERLAQIERDRKELSGEFCRGCGYCMPCPVGIEINNCARMSLLLRRSPVSINVTPEMQTKMAKIPNCIHCNQCKSRCPYGLDTPALLRRNYEDYLTFL